MLQSAVQYPPETERRLDNRRHEFFDLRLKKAQHRKHIQPRKTDYKSHLHGLRSPFKFDHVFRNRKRVTAATVQISSSDHKSINHVAQVDATREELSNVPAGLQLAFELFDGILVEIGQQLLHFFRVRLKRFADKLLIRYQFHDVDHFVNMALRKTEVDREAQFCKRRRIEESQLPSSRLNKTEITRCTCGIQAQTATLLTGAR